MNTKEKKPIEYIDFYGEVKLYSEPKKPINYKKKSVKVKKEYNENKFKKTIKEVLLECKIKSGMTLSFHHHLRNGDKVLNTVIEEVAKLGVKGINIAPSSLFPVHNSLVKYIKNETITGIYSNYISGEIGEVISDGKLKNPIVMHTHGGRARAIESGDLNIDIAFISAPSCDIYGNINGIKGKSQCGTLGYAAADAEYAVKTVAVTDSIVEYPNYPMDINQKDVDYIVEIESIGEKEGIASGTTKITKDPVGLKIAEDVVKVIEKLGYIKNGLSFQTGAGGVSLAVAEFLKTEMIKKEVVGSFASGGITKPIVEMLELGLFKKIMDVQCFDIPAVESYKNNENHISMTASMYGNIHNKGAVVDMLDVMILGATEIDLEFNVNVTTSSQGIIMGGSGGHSDTAAGSKLSIVATQLTKGRIPIVVDKVTTCTTPGETIDLLVTEWGISVNPKNTKLKEKLEKEGLNILEINELKNKAQKITGKPKKAKFFEKIVGIIEYRDGTVIDTIKKVKR